MKLKIVAICSVVVGLVGCASMTEKYVEPTSGSIASIRFVASSPLSGNIFIMAIDGEGECGSNAAGIPVKNVRNIGILHGIALAHNRKKLGMPLSENINEKDLTEIKIPAGKLNVFDIHLLSTRAGGFIAPGTYVPSTIGCNVTLEFNPEDGKQYEAVFTVDPLQKRCSVSVAELVRSVDAKYTRRIEKTTRTRSPQCKW